MSATDDDGLFDDAFDALRSRNATVFAEAADGASLWTVIGFWVVAVPFALCVLNCTCNLLSSAVFLPCYLAFVAKHEPVLLGVDVPRSDADPLRPSFEDERSRFEHMLRERALAGERLGVRIDAMTASLRVRSARCSAWWSRSDRFGSVVGGEPGDGAL